MLTFTVTQLVIMGLLFVAGWLLGLASHPGGRKWKERYAAERDAHASYRRDADARVAAADKRAADLERDNQRLAKAAPVSAGMRPMSAARPAHAPADRATYSGERRGWFDWGNRAPADR